MRISDQSAAIKLAICDDIGERSYDVTDVAAVLVQMLSKLPKVGLFSSLSLFFFPNCYLRSVLELHIFLSSMPRNVIRSLQVQKLFTTVTRLRRIVNVVKRKLLCFLVGALVLFALINVLLDRNRTVGKRFYARMKAKSSVDKDVLHSIVTSNGVWLLELICFFILF